jgi:hypothetical protein
VAYKSAWGEDRVYFYNEEQQLLALPASWTDVIATDPFVSMAGGRALFRADDLLELADCSAACREKAAMMCKVNVVLTVMKMLSVRRTVALSRTFLL